MKKKGLLLFSIFLLFLFIISCSLPQEQATTIAKGESVIFSPENFTLVGFWKIEQKFLLDEEKSTENNLQWVEVSVPKEKYKEFREWCWDRENNQKLLERADVIPGQTEDYGDGSSVTVYPTLSIIPSPALPSGFVPNGVCYFHRVDKTPDEGRISLLMEISAERMPRFNCFILLLSCFTSPSKEALFVLVVVKSFWTDFI